MTDIYPLPPPFSDDEVLQPLRPHSDAPPPKRGKALTAGVAAGAAVLAVGLGIAGFALVGSGGPGPRDGTTAGIDPAPKASASPREPAATASVGPPPAAASVAPPAARLSAEPAAPLPVAVAPPLQPPAPPAVAAPPAAAPAEAQPPQPAAPARQPLRRLASEEIRLHLDRGEALLAQGDLAAARLFFERVAEAGDARGAIGLARSYDPSVLTRLPVHGIAGDATEAERWRRVAASMAPAFAERR
jgi:hypothetical protein